MYKSFEYLRYGADRVRRTTVAVCLLACCLAIPSPADTTSDKSAEQLALKGVIITIEGELTAVTVESVSRRLDEVVKKQADVVIFELDTPGGLVDSSIAIADLIKNLEGIKSVAWVNPEAHSGGSIVAVACNEIVMAKSSRMGDSQVIMGGPTGVAAVPKELQPKAYTPVLAEFRASARLNGYDQKLCEAMVKPEREVWWLENTETGERKFVFREEKQKLLGEPASPAKASSDKKSDDDDKDKSKDDDDAQEDDEAAAAESESKTASKSETTEHEKTDWKLVETYYDPLLDMEVEAYQPVVPDDQLLEMSAGEAHAYGFSKGIATNEDDLRARYSLSSLYRLTPSWSEALAFWMTSLYVRGFVLVIIMLGAYVEFHTPGVGVPGLVALICLGIFVGAPYLTGLANVWELAFVALGVVLIALEVFVIPGFGVAGISGLMLMIIGLLATFAPDEPGRSFPIYLPSLPATIDGVKYGMITLVSSMCASLVGMVVLSRLLPRTPWFRWIVPANPMPSEVLIEDPYRGVARVGDTGMAEGPLHPAGKARFGSTLVDVVTQGEYLESGNTVEVVERRGNRVVVRIQP